MLSRVVVAGTDAVLGAAVLAVAAWTIVFQLALVAGIERDPATAVWLGLWAGFGTLVWRLDRAEPRPAGGGSVLSPFDRAEGLRWLVGGVALAVAVAVTEPVGVEWPAAWIVIGLFALGGLVAANVSTQRDRSAAVARSNASALGAVVVVLIAVTFAGLSLLTSRPDLDDVFVVNRSSYVEANDGTFPERDTIFSDELFAVQRPAAPQTSVEAMIGSIAAQLPVSAAGLSYLVIAPIASALAILALWRLTESFGVRRPALAVLAAGAFILLDGVSAQSFGNFHFARAWQGKTIFLIVLLPVLWRSCLEFGRTGSRRHLALAGAAAIGAVGATTSAVFIVPVVAVVVLAAAAATHGNVVRNALGAAVVLSPPAIAGLANLTASAQPAEVPSLAFIDIGISIGDIDPSGQLYLVLGTGVALAIGLGATLVGWFFVPDPAARLAIAGTALALLGVFLAPGVLDRVDAFSSAESVLWRIVWIVPVPALVGTAVAALLEPLAKATRPAIVLPAIAFAAMAIWGRPVLSADNAQLTFDWPPPYDLPAAELTAADTLRDLTPSGSTVGAPQPVGYALAVTNVHVRSVNPRWRYLAGRHVVPEFLVDERDTVSRWLTDGVPDGGADQFVAALQAFDISVLCESVDAGGSTAAVLEGAGYSSIGSDEVCVYWVADDLGDR